MLKSAEYCKNIIQKESESMISFALSVDDIAIEATVNELYRIREQHRKVIIAGCGMSGVVGRKIAHTLNVVNIPAFISTPSDAAHGDFGALQEGDLLILLSKGGKTQELYAYVQPAKTKGVTIIVVTEKKESILGRAADITLIYKTESEADEWGLIATSSTVSVIALWDGIILAAAQKCGLTKDEFLLVHPGGEVGQKLADSCNRGVSANFNVT